MKRRAALVWNPTAGRGVDAQRTVAAVLAERYELDQRAAATVEDARLAARRAASEGLDVLFVLGGDGSLRLAARELLGSPTALGPLPGGTTNVVARALGLPAAPAAAARVLVGAAPRTLDVGRVGDREIFLMQASGGLDARVMSVVDPFWKRRLGMLAIGWTALREWVRYRFPEFGLEIDGEAASATGFVLANFAEYAGVHRIVPHARPDDRRLEILLYRGRRRRHALAFALDLVRDRHARRADVEIRPATRVRVVAPERPEIQVDGDPLPARSPITLRLSARQLLVLAPAI